MVNQSTNKEPVMRAMMLKSGLLAVVAMVGGSLGARAADSYTLDPAHASATFKVEHLGLSWIHGRFNDVAGEFRVDPENPSASRFSLTIKSESVDTANKKRDEHLASPDFFNAKQFPLITFKSTAVKAVEHGLEVTGDLTLHGETKPVTLLLTGGKTGEFPPGVHRRGYTTHLKIKRSDYGMDKMLQAVGDEVVIEISFEGVKS
jgi:polyisoprenoid-binding protein YceI